MSCCCPGAGILPRTFHEHSTGNCLESQIKTATTQFPCRNIYLLLGLETQLGCSFKRVAWPLCFKGCAGSCSAQHNGHILEKGGCLAIKDTQLEHVLQRFPLWNPERFPRSLKSGDTGGKPSSYPGAREIIQLRRHLSHT